MTYTCHFDKLSANWFELNYLVVPETLNKGCEKVAKNMISFYLSAE